VARRENPPASLVSNSMVLSGAGQQSRQRNLQLIGIHERRIPSGRGALRQDLAVKNVN
jgi:hypothetical protein